MKKSISHCFGYSKIMALDTRSNTRGLCHIPPAPTDPTPFARHRAWLTQHSFKILSIFGLVLSATVMCIPSIPGCDHDLAQLPISKMSRVDDLEEYAFDPYIASLQSLQRYGMKALKSMASEEWRVSFDSRSSIISIRGHQELYSAMSKVGNMISSLEGRTKAVSENDIPMRSILFKYLAGCGIDIRNAMWDGPFSRLPMMLRPDLEASQAALHKCLEDFVRKADHLHKVDSSVYIMAEDLNMLVKTDLANSIRAVLFQPYVLPYQKRDRAETKTLLELQEGDDEKMEILNNWTLLVSKMEDQIEGIERVATARIRLFWDPVEYAMLQSGQRRKSPLKLESYMEEQLPVRESWERLGLLVEARFGGLYDGEANLATLCPDERATSWVSNVLRHALTEFERAVDYLKAQYRLLTSSP